MSTASPMPSSSTRGCRAAGTANQVMITEKTNRLSRLRLYSVRYPV